MAEAPTNQGGAHDRAGKAGSWGFPDAFGDFLGPAGLSAAAEVEDGLDGINTTCAVW